MTACSIHFEHIPVALRQLAEVERSSYSTNMFVVYAIYNREHDKIYIGQTQDLQDRLRMHNDHTLGGFTSRYSGEWITIYTESVSNRKEALDREKQLKSYRGREFIRKHIPR